MADAAVVITSGTGTNIDTRTEATNGNHRQVVVLGDPATNAGVAPVDVTAGLKVDLGADNDITGTVTANLSATDNAVLDAIAASVDTIDSVDFATQTTLAAIKAKTDNIPALGQALAAASVPVILPSATITTLTPPAAITGFATSAKQDDIITAIEAIPGGGGVQYTEGDTDASITGTASLVEGAANALAVMTQPLTDTQLRASDVKITLDGESVPITNAGITTIAGAVAGTEMQVDVLTMPTVTVNSHAVTNAGTFAVQVDGNALTSLQLIDDTVATTASAIPSKGQAVSGTDGTNARVLKTDTSGELQVDVLTMPTTAVTQSGTWDEVGINDSGNSITVDYATTGSGTATGALRVELPTNGTGVIATVGAVTAITNALPAGTNAIGKLAANSGVDIGDVDVTSVSGTVTTKGIPSDIDINGSNANHADKYYTNAGAVTDGIVWSPAAGKRWHILTLYINVSAAATVTLEDDLAGGDVVRWKGELAANSGVVLTYDKEHPFSSGEDAADLIITTSAGNVYVQAVGYEV